MRTEPVGEWEIAELLGVQRGTVRKWKFRGLLPKPRFTVNRAPAWSKTDILRWAQRTGRAA